jgi:hypothetical protein
MQPRDRKAVTEEDNVAPVTILDGMGRVMQIVAAAEFRKDHPAPERSTLDKRRRKRASGKTNGAEPDTNQLAEAS